MVLVELKGYLGDGQMYKALCVGFEALPLDHQIESCHGEGQAGPEVVPTTMHYLLKMPDQGEHIRALFRPSCVRSTGHVCRV